MKIVINNSFIILYVILVYCEVSNAFHSLDCNIIQKFSLETSNQD